MNNVLKNAAMLLALGSITLTGCKKDPDEVVKPTPPNENELITTFKLVMKDDSNPESLPLVFTWRDIDGDGPGLANPWDTLRLKSNTTYSTSLLLLDETKTPADTISDEVDEEGDEHQFFYKATDALLTVAYEDRDENGVPVGLFTKITTKAAGTGSLNIVLKHQPDVKPKSGSGDETKGSTDINLTFVVEVKAPPALIVEAK